MERWQNRLGSGDSESAWEDFVARHGRLIRASIRRLLNDEQELDDAYATVCAALIADDFARLRRYAGDSRSGASVSTWLVVVVRNIVIDGIRRRDGRQRRTIPPGLSELHRKIYEALCLDGSSPAEAFERLRLSGAAELSFAAFLRDARALRRSHPCPDALPVRRPLALSDGNDVAVGVGDPAEVADLARRLHDVLAIHPVDVRLAVQLFVIEELTAAEVARVVGWPNAKAVYNRVSRALDAMRAALQREGVGRDDL